MDDSQFQVLEWNVECSVYVDVVIVCMVLCFISFELKQKELELQKQRALREYHQKKASSSRSFHQVEATPLESSDTDHEAVLSSEYQEVVHNTYGGAVTQQNEQRDRMEQKIREELMSNFYSDTQSTMASSGSNRATNTLSSTLLSPTRFREATLNPTCTPETDLVAGRPESSIVMSPSPELRSEEHVVTSGSGQSAVAITTSPSLPKSKPPQLTHSDSNVEWTEYTSAVLPVDKTVSDSIVSLQTTDLSEFDPISNSKQSV